jgi:membrane-bound inhibitor of C-type lysozyme
MVRILRTWVVLLCVFGASQAGARHATVKSFFTFHCGDGTEFLAAFYQGRSDAYVKLDGKTMTLLRRISFSGARYSAGGITLRIEGNSAFLSRGKNSTDCSSYTNPPRG